MMRRMLRWLAAAALAGVGFFTLYEQIEAPGTQLFGPTLVAGSGHVVALTFDDGPDAQTTPRLLEVLERDRVRATFFVVGRAVLRHPEIVRRMLRDGDEIGNHTQTHAHLNFLLTQRALADEIDAAQAAISAATGTTARYLRPPFGARDYAAIDAARRRGLQVVMWSAMLGDESSAAGGTELARRLLRQVRDGAIIVMHDGDQGRPGGGGRSYESAAAQIVIAQLKARGYRFVTISQLESSRARSRPADHA
jgi:peptidoglycan/xylan/chitin deacetylase (PgdA/CDA1 family)